MAPSQEIPVRSEGSVAGAGGADEGRLLLDGPLLRRLFFGNAEVGPYRRAGSRRMNQLGTPRISVSSIVTKPNLS